MGLLGPFQYMDHRARQPAIAHHREGGSVTAMQMASQQQYQESLHQTLRDGLRAYTGPVKFGDQKIKNLPGLIILGKALEYRRSQVIEETGNTTVRNG